MKKFPGRPHKHESKVSIERTQLAGAVDDVDGVPIHLKADESSGSLRVNLWAWDTKTFRFVRQPFIDVKKLEQTLDKLTNAVNDLVKELRKSGPA